MFQPSPRVSQDEWLAMPSDEWNALDDESVEVPMDAPWPEPDPYADSPAGLAWEDFERELIASRKRDAVKYVRLLAAKQAALADAALPREMAERAFQSDAAHALDVSETAAVTLIHQLELVKRWFPKSWTAFVHGRTDLRCLRIAAQQAGGLDLDQYADAYDTAVVDAFERIPGTRLKQHLHVVRERLQADTATKRHQEALQGRSVAMDLLPDGMAMTMLIGPAVDAVAFDDAVQRVAVIVHGRQGEERSITQLRYDISRDLLLGGISTTVNDDGSQTTTMTVPKRPAIVAKVHVTIPALTLMGRTDAGPASLDGYGPIDTETATRLACDAPVWTRVLTDPVTGVRLTMDEGQYSPSRALRRWLQLRDGTCRWPGCTRPASRSDIDHRTEWQDGGPTAADNLVHLCRKHHLAKSTGNYPSVHDPATERITWTSPGHHQWLSDAAPPSEPAPPDLLGPCPF